MPTIQSPVTDEIHPDVALVERAKKGDTAAFEQLVRQYERQIFRVAQHITQNREDAEDITQDAFFKAYGKLDQFQGNSKFSTWLVADCGERKPDEAAQAQDEQDRLHGRGLQTEDGSIPRDFAEWRPNPEQLYGQSELGEILRKTIQGCRPDFAPSYIARRGKPLDRRDCGGTRLERSAVKSRCCARDCIARAAEPLLPATNEGAKS